MGIHGDPVGATEFEFPTKVDLMGLAAVRNPQQGTAAPHSENTPEFSALSDRHVNGMSFLTQAASVT